MRERGREGEGERERGREGEGEGGREREGWTESERERGTEHNTCEKRLSVCMCVRD